MTCTNMWYKHAQHMVQTCMTMHLKREMVDASTEPNPTLHITTIAQCKGLVEDERHSDAEDRVWD